MRTFITCNKGVTTTHLAVGFAVFGLVGALFMPAMMGDRDSAGHRLVAAFTGPGVDRITTGSVGGEQNAKQRYTLRRSVLQTDSSRPCILYDSGRREGDC